MNARKTERHETDKMRIPCMIVLLTASVHFWFMQIIQKRINYPRPINKLSRLLSLSLSGTHLPTPTTSVTRLGNLLDFGHLFKQLATIDLPKSFLGNFVMVSKSLIFVLKSFLSNFQTFGYFYWSHCLRPCARNT